MSNKPLANPTAFTGQSPPWSLTQLDQNFTSIQNTINDLLTYSNYFADQSGVVNSIIVSIPNTLTVALTAGTLLFIKINNTNTAAVTITINALAAQAIVNPDLSALAPNQLLAGQIATIIYDGTRFQYLGLSSLGRTAAEIAAGVTPTSFLYTANPLDLRRYGGGPGLSVALNNAAFDAARAVHIQQGFLNVYLTGGTWAYGGVNAVDHLWFQKGNIRIFGDGIGVTVLQPSAWVNGIAVADANYPASTTLLTGITVTDLTIDGVNQTAGSGTDTYGNGLNLTACDGVEVQRVEIKNSRYQSIVSTALGGVQQKAQIIANCIVRAGATTTTCIGVEATSGDTVVANNIVTGVLVTGTGILVATGTSGTFALTGRSIVANNRVTGNTGAGGVGIAVLDGSYRNEVIGNHILGPDISIQFVSSTGGRHVTDVLISGNYCLEWTSSAIQTAMAAASGDSTEAKISNNLIKSSIASGSSRAIQADKNAMVSDNNILSGNTGIYCLNNGQVLIGNRIKGTVTASIDTLSSVSTGVICQANVWDTLPNLNSDTTIDWPSGLGNSVASAASITLPLFGDTFQVTGNTGITSISSSGSGRQGQVIKLVFAAALTVTNGSNLVLNGNFTTQANSVLTLVGVGNNWLEIARRL